MYHIENNLFILQELYSLSPAANKMQNVIIIIFCSLLLT